MRAISLPMSLIAALAVFQLSAAQNNPQSATPPIDNASRPGAGSPICGKLKESADKCVFHTKKGQVDTIRLPVSAGFEWTARMNNAAAAKIGQAKIETLADGTTQQVMQVIPQSAEDVDAILTLEKRSTTNASQVLETRALYFMIHATPAP